MTNENTRRDRAATLAAAVAEIRSGVLEVVDADGRTGWVYRDDEGRLTHHRPGTRGRPERTGPAGGAGPLTPVLPPTGPAETPGRSGRTLLDGARPAGADPGGGNRDPLRSAETARRLEARYALGEASAKHRGRLWPDVSGAGDPAAFAAFLRERQRHALEHLAKALDGREPADDHLAAAGWFATMGMHVEELTGRRLHELARAGPEARGMTEDEWSALNLPMVWSILKDDGGGDGLSDRDHLKWLARNAELDLGTDAPDGIHPVVIRASRGGSPADVRAEGAAVADGKFRAEETAWACFGAAVAWTWTRWGREDPPRVFRGMARRPEIDDVFIESLTWNPGDGVLELKTGS